LLVSDAVDGFLEPILNDLGAFRAMTAPALFISKCKFLRCRSMTRAQFDIPSIGSSKARVKIRFGLAWANPVQCGVERQSIRINRLPFLSGGGPVRLLHLKNNKCFHSF
jgi:hypothetical protein